MVLAVDVAYVSCEIIMFDNMQMSSDVECNIEIYCVSKLRY